MYQANKFLILFLIDQSIPRYFLLRSLAEQEEEGKVAKNGKSSFLNKFSPSCLSTESNERVSCRLM